MRHIDSRRAGPQKAKRQCGGWTSILSFTESPHAAGWILWKVSMHLKTLNGASFRLANHSRFVDSWSLESWLNAKLVKNHGWRCTPSAVLYITLRAAARCVAITAACRDMAKAPSDRAVMTALEDGLPRRCPHCQTGNTGQRGTYVEPAALTRRGDFANCPKIIRNVTLALLVRLKPNGRVARYQGQSTLCFLRITLAVRGTFCMCERRRTGQIVQRAKRGDMRSV